MILLFLFAVEREETALGLEAVLDRSSLQHASHAVTVSETIRGV